MSKVPTKWQVPEGYVLTWFPPFTFPMSQPTNRRTFVYDQDEPFIPLEDAAGNILGYNPNGVFKKLGDLDNQHPGAYALNIQGEESDEKILPAAAVRMYGKKVSS